MPYQISDYTRDKASKLGVVVKPSSKKGKKIDVYKNDKLVASIGAISYADYPTYIREKGIEYANQRRKAYRQRHAKDIGVVGSPGFFSSNLLW